MLLSGKSSADSNDKFVTNKIDHGRTIDILTEKVQQDFPKMDEDSLKNFMPSVLNFVVKIRYVIHMKEGYIDKFVNCFSISSSMTDLSSLLPTVCVGCGSRNLKQWPYPAKTPALISSGRIVKASIPVLVCECGIANYPDVTRHGVFPIHNRCLITLDLIIEIRNVLASGTFSKRTSRCFDCCKCFINTFLGLGG